MPLLIKRIPLFQTALVIVILAIHLYAAFADAYVFPNNWFARDDAFYYFKVAQNITEGHGVTFDGINRTNGYHPLWLVVCIPIFYLARFDLVLPLRILLMVMACLNAATAVLIYRITSRALSKPVAMFAASFWAFNLYFHYSVYEFGLETPLAVFAIALLIDRLALFESHWRKQVVTHKQIAALALLSSLAMFSRLDLVFLAVIVGVYLVFRGSPIRYLLSLDLLALFFSTTFSVGLRVGFINYTQFADAAVLSALTGTVIKIIALYFLGGYERPKSKITFSWFLHPTAALIIASILNALLVLTLTFTDVIENFPLSAFFYDLGLSIVLIFIIRVASRWFTLNNKFLNPPALSMRVVIGPSINQLRQNWKIWLTEGVIYYGILGGLLGLYMFYNKIAFGVSSPVSGQIKRWWGSLHNTVYDYPATNIFAFLGIEYEAAYNAWNPVSMWLVKIAEKIKPLYPGSNTEDERYYIVFAATALIILTILFIGSRHTARAFSKMAMIPLIAASGLHILSYSATAYGGAKEWYWLSQMILMTLGIAVLIEILLLPIMQFKWAKFPLQFVSVVLALIFASQQWALVRTVMVHNYFPPDRPLMEVVAYLEENTPPGSKIGMTGGGNVGYLIKDRTIINMDGLINSAEYFHALQNGTAPQFLKAQGMDIVFANSKLLSASPYFGQFDAYLESFNVFGGKGLFWLLEEPKY